jgi:hypothetical protein
MHINWQFLLAKEWMLMNNGFSLGRRKIRVSKTKWNFVYWDLELLFTAVGCHIAQKVWITVCSVIAGSLSQFKFLARIARNMGLGFRRISDLERGRDKVEDSDVSTQHLRLSMRHVRPLFRGRSWQWVPPDTKIWSPIGPQISNLRFHWRKYGHFVVYKV